MTKNKNKNGILISNVMRELELIDYHNGLIAKKKTLDVITYLRNAQIDDDNIIKILRVSTALNEDTIAKYMKGELISANARAELIEEFGLPEYKRYLPPMPKPKQMTDETETETERDDREGDRDG
jgi:uncharacterized protein YehS (DUF1456 family)